MFLPLSDRDRVMNAWIDCAQAGRIKDGIRFLSRSECDMLVRVLNLVNNDIQTDALLTQLCIERRLPC